MEKNRDKKIKLVKKIIREKEFTIEDEIAIKQKTLANKRKKLVKKSKEKIISEREFTMEDEMTIEEIEREIMSINKKKYKPPEV